MSASQYVQSVGLSIPPSNSVSLIGVADDIDSHIENAVVATTQAKGQLSKAAKTQKSNSSLVIQSLLLHYYYPPSYILETAYSIFINYSRGYACC